MLGFMATGKVPLTIPVMGLVIAKVARARMVKVKRVECILSKGNDFARQEVGESSECGRTGSRVC